MIAQSGQDCTLGSVFSLPANEPPSVVGNEYGKDTTEMRILLSP